MSDSDQDIVQNLRDAADVAFRDDIGLFLSKEDCSAAADEIESLRAEVARLKGIVGAKMLETGSAGSGEG